MFEFCARRGLLFAWSNRAAVFLSWMVFCGCFVSQALLQTKHRSVGAG